MTEDERLTAEEVVDYFKDEFKDKVEDARIETWSSGTEKSETSQVWMKVDKSVFKDWVKHLCDLSFPHLAVVSGNDLEETIELIYHFSIYYSNPGEEMSLNLSVEVPKEKPEIETICDYIPGALITEREKQEMLGIKVKGIPDERRLFLPDDWPEDVYPWRKDEKGMEKYVRNLHDKNKDEGDNE